MIGFSFSPIVTPLWLQEVCEAGQPAWPRCSFSVYASVESKSCSLMCWRDAANSAQRLACLIARATSCSQYEGNYGYLEPFSWSEHLELCSLSHGCCSVPVMEPWSFTRRTTSPSRFRSRGAPRSGAGWNIFSMQVEACLHGTTSTMRDSCLNLRACTR